VIGAQLAAQIQFVCSDMWQPYLDVIRQKCSQALHILDRFHIVAKMNKALDEVRAAENSQDRPRGPRAAPEKVPLVHPQAEREPQPPQLSTARTRKHATCQPSCGIPESV